MLNTIHASEVTISNVFSFTPIYCLKRNFNIFITANKIIEIRKDNYLNNVLEDFLIHHCFMTGCFLVQIDNYFQRSFSKWYIVQGYPFRLESNIFTWS